MMSCWLDQKFYNVGTQHVVILGLLFTSHISILSSEWALYNKICQLFKCLDGPPLSCVLNQSGTPSSSRFEHLPPSIPLLVVPFQVYAILLKHSRVSCSYMGSPLKASFYLASTCVYRQARLRMHGGIGFPLIPSLSACLEC